MTRVPAHLATLLLATLSVLALLALLALAGCSAVEDDPSGSPSYVVATPEPTALDVVCAPLESAQVLILGEAVDLDLVGLDRPRERRNTADNLDRVAALGVSTLAGLDAVTPRPDGYGRFRRAFAAAHVGTVRALARELRVSDELGFAGDTIGAVRRLGDASARVAEEAEAVGAPTCGAVSVVPGQANPPFVAPPSLERAPREPGGSDDTQPKVVLALAALGVLGLVVGAGFLIGYLWGRPGPGLVTTAVGGVGVAAIALAFDPVVDRASEGDEMFAGLGEALLLLFVGVGGAAVFLVGVGMTIGGAVRRRRAEQGADPGS